MDTHEQILTLECILDCQLEAHQMLLTAAYQMNTALKQQIPAQVKAACLSYDELSCSIEQQEEKRLELCSRIGESLNPPTDHPSLDLILRSVAPEPAARLGGIRTRLKKTIEELTKINTSNRILIEDALDSSARFMDLMSRAGMKPAGYQRQGAPCNRSDATLIINKTA